VFWSKVALDSLLAGQCQLTGQGFVAEQSSDRLGDCGYITRREKKAGLAIHNRVHDPRRPGGRHWFACGLRLQNNIGKAFPVARQNEDIHERVVRGGILDQPTFSILTIEMYFIALGSRLFVSHQDHVRMRL
jgi:hypothetical protein